VVSVPPSGGFAVDAAGSPAVHDAFVTDPEGEVSAAPDVTFVLERPGLVTPADPVPGPTYTRWSFVGATDDAGAPGYPTFTAGAL
jgi:hypothetical protein